MRRNHAFIAAVAVLLASASATADDRGGLVPWEALAQVSVTKQKDRYVPEFSSQYVTEPVPCPEHSRWCAMSPAVFFTALPRRP